MFHKFCSLPKIHLFVVLYYLHYSVPENVILKNISIFTILEWNNHCFPILCYIYEYIWAWAGASRIIDIFNIADVYNSDTKYTCHLFLRKYSVCAVYIHKYHVPAITLLPPIHYNGIPFSHVSCIALKLKCLHPNWKSPPFFFNLFVQRFLFVDGIFAYTCFK